jgi:hypothetical protein
MLETLVDRIQRKRGAEPDLIVSLKIFEGWCRKAGFSDSGAALGALCAEGHVRSWRIQSGRIKLFFEAR